MSDPSSSAHCINCRRSEHEAPLVSLRFGGQPAWICTACLPVLIHHPEKLAERLPGARPYVPDAGGRAAEG